LLKRYGLRDDQWERIEGLLPGRAETVGVTAKDNRLFVEAVLYRYRAGIAWRDLPARFGDFRVIHTRHMRWSRSGVWQRIFEHLAADSDNEYAMIDATFPDTKGGAQIRAIGPAAVKVVGSQPGIVGNPHVFPSEVGTGPFTAVSACLQRVAKLAAIEGITPHTLRHTFGSVKSPKDSLLAQLEGRRFQLSEQRLTSDPGFR